MLEGKTLQEVGTHIAQVQELRLAGQAEEGGADDQVNLHEGHCLLPGLGGPLCQNASPAAPRLPSPAGWAAEWPGGRAAP